MVTTTEIAIKHEFVRGLVLPDGLWMDQWAQCADGQPLKIALRHRVGRIRPKPNIGDQIHIGRCSQATVIPDAGRPLIVPGIDLAPTDPIE